MKDMFLYFGCRFIAGIVLLSCLESCLSIGERRTVLEKKEIGKENVDLDYRTFPPEIDGEFILVGIEQKASYKYKSKIRLSREIERNSEGEICGGSKVEYYDRQGTKKFKCEYNYKYSLILATVFTVGAALPLVALFDWLPAQFKTGEEEFEEETIEGKYVRNCSSDNPLNKGKAFLEYTFDDEWKVVKRVPIKNCFARIPITNDFNNAYEFTYRININQEIYNSGIIAYNTGGDRFFGTESKKFKEARQKADQLFALVLEKERKESEERQTQEIKQCESFFNRLVPYFKLNTPVVGAGPTCSVTCDRFVRFNYPTNSWGKFPECVTRCKSCWSSVGWDQSGKDSNGTSGGYNYDDLKTMKSY